MMDSEPNIRNKISRGKFTAVFLVQCLEAIGAKRSTALTEQPDNARSGQQPATGNDEPGGSNTGDILVPVKQAASPNETTTSQQQAQTEQPSTYTVRDLIAQETMADASVGMMWAALGTLVVTAIGPGFVRAAIKKQPLPTLKILASPADTTAT